MSGDGGSPAHNRPPRAVGRGTGGNVTSARQLTDARLQAGCGNGAGERVQAVAERRAGKVAGAERAQLAAGHDHHQSSGRTQFLGRARGLGEVADDVVACEVAGVRREPDGQPGLQRQAGRGRDPGQVCPCDTALKEISRFRAAVGPTFDATAGGLELCRRPYAGDLARSIPMNSRIQAGWSGQARADTICPSVTAAPSTNSAPANVTSGASAG